MADLLARLLAALRATLADHVRELADAARGRWRVLLARRPPARVQAARLLVLALALAAAWSGWAQGDLRRRLPSPLDWEALRALLARDARPGDAVALAPAWLEQGRAAAPAGLPVLALRRLDEEPLPGVRRVWLVSAPRVPHRSWAADLDLARRAARAEAQPLGALELVRYDLAEPLVPLADLADLVPAQAQLRDVEGAPRRCLVLQAQPGAPQELVLRGVPLGRALAGHVAPLPGRGDLPVHLSFRADGVELGALDVGPSDRRRSFRLEAGRLGAAPRDLTLVLTAPGATARPLCLEARSVP